MMWRRDNYCCLDCGWVGEEPPVQRDGDPYDQSTNFWKVCPVCLSTNITPIEDIE